MNAAFRDMFDAVTKEQKIIKQWTVLVDVTTTQESYQVKYFERVAFKNSKSKSTGALIKFYHKGSVNNVLQTDFQRFKLNSESITREKLNIWIVLVFDCCTQYKICQKCFLLVCQELS